MTTTLAAMQAGNPRLAFVLVIDGYPHVFSNVAEALVQAAWDETDWVNKSVIGGVSLELDNHQKLSPWNPFEGGGQLIVKIQPDADDLIGIDMARTDDGAETLLDETANRTSTLFVGFLDDFPLTGEAYVGTECFEYGLVSGRRFGPTLGLTAGSNRGKYVAFGAKDSASTYGSVRFAEHHRVATQDNGVPFRPVVSEQPRTWKGRRVSLWAHVYESNGALNHKNDALCVFVGELSESQDISETGNTHILSEHLLSRIPKITLGREGWRAEVSYGVTLTAGQRFKFKDNDNTGFLDADDLVVVADGATTTNQVDAGQYGHEELAAILTAWLGGESAASRIHGMYSITCPEDDDGIPRTFIRFFVPGATTTPCSFSFKWPSSGWGIPLGFKGLYFWEFNNCGAWHKEKSPDEMQPFSIATQEGNGSHIRIALDNQTGVFIGQNDTLPSVAGQQIEGENPPHEYGLFMLEGELPMLLLGTVEGGYLRRVRPLTTGFGFDIKGFDALWQGKYPIGAAPPRLRQVFVHEAKMSTYLKWLFYSTGTAGYNHPDYDVLPYGQGIGIPYDMLGDIFEYTCDAMPGADNIITVVIDKPRTIADIFRADLVMRNAHLVFREGGFRWVSWASPSSAIVTFTLDESNKAEPIDNRISQRTASVLDASWVRNYVKINYNRDIGKSIGSGEDVYLSPPLIFEDATSIDDQGGVPTPITLDLKNVYGDTDQVGQGVRALSAGLVSWMSWWSRPLWKQRRSIAPTLFEGYGVGDCPAVTDPFVRDPTTGQRGLVTRPGLIVEHRYQIIVPPAPAKMKFAGEVSVVFSHNDRVFPYGPAAELDETKNDGGFTSGFDGTSTFQFYAHQHSESYEDVDVASFASGDAVRLIEIDPDDPAVTDVIDFEVDTVDEANNRIVATTDLSGHGFDTTKRYRLVYAGYGLIQGSQAIKSFQSGSNLTIANASPPDNYGANPTSIKLLSTLYDHTRLPELLSDLSYGPNVGAVRDCAYDRELALLIENMTDHAVRSMGPALGSASTALGSGAGWNLLRVEEMYIGGDVLLGGGVQRYLNIAPYWRSTGSATVPGDAQIRIWISGYPPIGDGTQNVPNAEPGYVIKAPAAGNSWGTDPEDRAWRADEPKAYPLGNMNGHQYIYIIVEGTETVQTRGLHEVSESERFEI